MGEESPRDEHLAWLAVQGHAGRKPPRSVTSAAVDHVTGLLSDEERDTLRGSSEVPPWFLFEVKRTARTLRRKRPLPAARETPRERLRRRLRRAALIVAVLVTVLLLPTVWVRAASAGRISTVEHAPQADVVIVFGAQVAPGGKVPMPFLRGRLDIGAQLIRTGKAKAMLISGDAHGGSGNEVAVMRDYLLGQGVDPARIVLDPDGLDTYDTCRRAHDVYGVRRALLVSQSLHLPRAVTLCRRLGIDAFGVDARCDGCQQVTIWYNTVRDVAAAPKAAWDAIRHRPPAVQSPPDPALRNAER